MYWDKSEAEVRELWTRFKHRVSIPWTPKVVNCIKYPGSTKSPKSQGIRDILSQGVLCRGPLFCSVIAGNSMLYSAMAGYGTGAGINVFFSKN